MNLGGRAVSKIALLSNSTIDMIADMLKKIHTVYYSAGFNIWQQEALDASSEFYKSQPEVTFILLYYDPYSDRQNNIDQYREMIHSWLCAIRQISNLLPKMPLFVSSLDICDKLCAAYSDNQFHKEVEAEWIGTLEEWKKEGAEIYILPVSEKIADIGRDQFYSRKMWYLGNMPYSMTGINAIADLICNACSSINGMRKKCIAVDLDNTLWGGVVGEDGIDGIILSEHKEGACFKDTQRLLLKMKKQGVLLVVLSKNMIDDVYEVFEKHPDMVLKKEDFVKIIANWESKASNIKKIAAELNIGLDAFVFLDDNPVEREQMKAECPEVVVADFPKDTSLLPEMVYKIYTQYFKMLRTTEEDAEKTQMYHNQAKRAKVMEQASNVEEYLTNLEIEVDIHFMREEEERRVVQLLHKTNQFNTTTKHYTEKEVHELGESPDSAVVTAYMTDRFGEEGLIAVMILLFSGDTAEIDNFLMSCRVMGRKLENVMIKAVSQWIMENRKEIKNISALYIKTRKNKPVENLYNSLGLRKIEEKEENKEVRKKYKIEIEELTDKKIYYARWKFFEKLYEGKRE